ncbi:MAG TPA: sugar ABC transporter ATP-binding protein [Solirubrobacteraceae bacterium]|nr:sugar ABC transporter ATP-binding protein [Solirubrobacteraceae bacterium]
MADAGADRSDEPAPAQPGRTAPCLEARGLAKHFGATRALAGVDLRIDAGEVVALLGENGSGKSTLVKILAGFHAPEPGGELRIGGAAVPLPVPLDAYREIGLSFVFQDLGLAPALTVVENLFVGRRVHAGPTKAISWRAERREARAVFERYGVRLAPEAIVGELRPTAQALLAIVRAAEELRRFRAGGGHGGLLVLDEPTVFLPEHEKVFLFDLIRRVAADGAGVLFVSHDMTAVREVASRAVVLRDGVKVGEALTRQTTDAELVALVSGHRLSAEDLAAAGSAGGEGQADAHAAAGTAAGEGQADAHAAAGRAGGEGPAAVHATAGAGGEPSARGRRPIALTVSGLSGGRLRGVELTLHEGEILGVAGLLGSGSEDLAYALFGAMPGSRGRLASGSFDGEVGGLSPRVAQQIGIALVPGDRKQQAIAPGLSVAANMMSLVLDRFTRRGALSHRALRDAAAQRAERYDVRPRAPSLPISRLSGGNQQKVVLARWLELEPRVLLLHEPTQGVDVATRAQIYRFLRERCARGAAILWVSTDFDELSKVCDRILVCAGGVITGEVPGPPFTRDRITSEVYTAAARRAPRSAGGGDGSAQEGIGTAQEVSA